MRCASARSSRPSRSWRRRSRRVPDRGRAACRRSPSGAGALRPPGPGRRGPNAQCGRTGGPPGVPRAHRGTARSPCPRAEQREATVAERDAKLTAAAGDHEMLKRLSERHRGEHERAAASREQGALDEMAAARFGRSRHERRDRPTVGVPEDEQAIAQRVQQLQGLIEQTRQAGSGIAPTSATAGASTAASRCRRETLRQHCRRRRRRTAPRHRRTERKRGRCRWRRRRIRQRDRTDSRALWHRSSGVARPDPAGVRL